MNRTFVKFQIARLAILATAFLVFWIYLSSIINFHQHHIFGKTLITNGILSKREESVEVSADLPSLDHFQSPIISEEATDYVLKSWFSEILLSSYCLEQRNLIGILADHGLRAPPVIS